MILSVFLEIKRTSITRLKRCRGIMRDARRWTWNQKNLDYEIETKPRLGHKHRPMYPWNQKNLDYEIETIVPETSPFGVCLLKSKEPRLRDWNVAYSVPYPALSKDLKSKEPRLRDWNSKDELSIPAGSYLKSKEPRLRDWNYQSICYEYLNDMLEIKRTSITRLKQYLSLLTNPRS